MSIAIGLFDIGQIDPLDPRTHGEVYRKRLDDVAFADELGFRYYFAAERHYMPVYRFPASTAWLSAVSQRTRQIRIGTMAYTLPIHQPVELAEEIAVLDWLSDGRLEVGVGLGHRLEELHVLGMDIPNRIRIFQQRLAVMEALWNGNEVSLDGDQTIVNKAVIHPLPQQKPQPPVWFAGGDVRSAQWAGSAGLSLALGFKLSSDLKPVADAFREQAAVYQAASDEDSKPGAGRLALMRQVYLAPTDEQAWSEMATDLIRLNAFGSEAPVEITPAEREKATEAVHQLIADEIFIAGSPASVVEQITRFQETIGFDVFPGQSLCGRGRRCQDRALLPIACNRSHTRSRLNENPESKQAGQD